MGIIGDVAQNKYFYKHIANTKETPVVVFAAVETEDNGELFLEFVEAILIVIFDLFRTAHAGGRFDKQLELASAARWPFLPPAPWLPGNRCLPIGMSSASKIGPSVCRLCGEQFESIDDVDEHYAEDHPGESPYQCRNNRCKMRFASFREFSEHEKRCLGCPACQKVFRSRKLLMKHRKRAHKIQKCDFEGCTFSTNRANILRVHQQVHSGTVEQRRTWECDYAGCTKKYTREDNLDLHKRAVSAYLS